MMTDDDIVAQIERRLVELGRPSCGLTREDMQFEMRTMALGLAAVREKREIERRPLSTRELEALGDVIRLQPAPLCVLQGGRQ